MPSDWYVDFFSGAALELWRRAAPPALTRAETDWLERALGLRRRAAVLDVPAGNGRLALELARRGHRVTAVELAAEFVAEGRAAAEAARLPVEWRPGDMRRLGRLLGRPAGRFDGALCWGNSLGYLERAGTAALLAALAKALRPGGRLALDTLMTAESLLPQLDHRMWVEVGGMHLLVENDYCVAESRLDIAYTFIDGARRETRHARHWIFTVGEIGAMLERAGFAVLSLAADLHGTPYTLGADRLLLVAERSKNS